MGNTAARWVIALSQTPHLHPADVPPKRAVLVLTPRPLNLTISSSLKARRRTQAASTGLTHLHVCVRTRGDADGVVLFGTFIVYYARVYFQLSED